MNDKNKKLREQSDIKTKISQELVGLNQQVSFLTFENDRVPPEADDQRRPHVLKELKKLTDMIDKLSKGAKVTGDMVRAAKSERRHVV